MKFPKEFFEGEYREEFYVEPMMKRYWASQLEILSKISEICDKYDIKYFALWGSLLGAVRHKGFVPWDDDIDIAMLRDDYEKFFEVAEAELPEGYRVLNVYKEPQWDVGVGRVTNYDGIIVTQDKLKEYHGCPYSTGIDIFPYDFLPDDKDSLEYLNNITGLIQTIKDSIVSSQAQNDSGVVGPLDKAILEGIEYLESIFGFQFNKSFHIVNQLDCLYDQVYSSMGNRNNRFVTCYMEKNKRKNDFKIPTYWLSETVEMKFEHVSISVPKYYEAVLSICYGKTYMIPIKSGVAGHDYPLYKSQITFMKDRGLDKVYEQSMLLYTEDYLDEEYAPPISHFLKKVDTYKKGEKKLILYCVSSMDVYGNEEKLVRKVENALALLYSNNEIDILFSYDPLILEMLEREHNNICHLFYKLIEEYENNSNIKIVDYDKAYQYASVADAYYGSCGECVKSFQLLNKPIMIQNIDVI